MSRRAWSVLALALLSAIPLAPPAPARDLAVVTPVRRLSSEKTGDQDDMCFWLHPGDLSRSTVIVSDKEAGSVFVYDLEGALLQTLRVPKPGNVDVRYGFPLGGDRVDIVALNERKTDKIRVYRVDPGTRQLSRVDDDRIDTGSNYGFALYRSHETGRTYAFTGPEKGPAVSQWELVDNGAGRISGRGPLRRLHHGGISEGMVADDETGVLYMSEEKRGIWKFGAEPSAAAAGARILAVGEHGLVADVEGITLYHGAGGAGYLIVSSQGADRFNVYERKPPHAFRGSFAVTGVAATDGCDLVNLPLGDPFPAGAFACHNGERTPCPDELVSWADIAKALGLVVDTTSWDPRRSGLPRPGEEARAGPGSTMSPR